MTEKKRLISRNDSAALYGIAILLMVFHHCFCIPSRLNYDYIPVLGGFELEARIAWLGKLCVAIYAFISGYAFAVISDRNQADNICRRFIADVGDSLHQLIRFYFKFCLVFAIFIPIGIVFYGKSAAPRDIIYGVLIGSGGYNDEWWYVGQYIKFLIVFPFIELIINYRSNKKTWGICLLGVALVVAVRLYAWNTFAGKALQFGINQFYSDYMLIFLMAFLIGKFSIFEKLEARFGMHLYIAIPILVACILFRWFYVTDAAQSDCDVIITPFLIYSLVMLLHISKADGVVQRVLRYFGKYSTYIWLTHTFWIYYYFQQVVLLPRYSLLIYLWALCLSLCTAILLSWIYTQLEKVFKSRRKSGE